MFSPFVLEGRHVRLEPLDLAHVAGLAAAGAEDRGSYGYTWVPSGEDEAHRYVESALEHQATGRAVPFAVRRVSDGAVVGSTRFLDLDVFVWGVAWVPGASFGPVPSDEQPPMVAEIGSTWYAASAQRTAVNTECKVLMLAHAFEVWKTLRVTLKTDARNEQSRRAIERIGAQFEGVRRAHAPATDGTVRDTAYYSIVIADWPAVRALLNEKLRRIAGSGGITGNG